MAGRTVNYIFLVLVFYSVAFPQSLMNRLKVPITLRSKLGFGYDDNFLRLSDKEIKEDLTQNSIHSTLDSPILKPSIKLIYSPVIMDGKTTNIVTSISYSHFTQFMQKSYLISNLSLEWKLRSYSWIKIGIRDIPKYYLREYRDRDLSLQDYFSCTFSSQKYYGSYSFPLNFIQKDVRWIRIYAEMVKEYYNPHFTEFDLNKYMMQLDFNHKVKNLFQVTFSIAHGYADNIRIWNDSNLTSANYDRSYVFDKIGSELKLRTRNINIVDNIGIYSQLEQRYYDLLSDKYSFDNWKYYLDGRVKIWLDWRPLDNVKIKTSYQLRWRDSSTQIYGDFDWIEDIKNYSKNEIWLEFSYYFTTDILY